MSIFKNINNFSSEIFRMLVLEKKAMKLNACIGYNLIKGLKHT